MSGRGRIYTYTIIYNAAEAFKFRTPYVIAIVEEDGHKRLAFIEGYEEGQDVSIGMEVELTGAGPDGNPVYRFV